MFGKTSKARNNLVSEPNYHATPRFFKKFISKRNEEIQSYDDQTSIQILKVLLLVKYKL